jgi:hypothetical protein
MIDRRHQIIMKMEISDTKRNEVPRIDLKLLAVMVQI